MSNRSSHEAWSKESSDPEREDRTLRVKPFVDKQGSGGLVNVLRTSGGGCLPNQHSGLRDKHFLKERSDVQKIECV